MVDILKLSSGVLASVSDQDLPTTGVFEVGAVIDFVVDEEPQALGRVVDEDIGEVFENSQLIFRLFGSFSGFFSHF